MSFDNDPFIADTPTQAADAYAQMNAGGYYSGSVIAEFHRHFPDVAIAQAIFDAHMARDIERHAAAQPPFDAMDLDSFQPFGPDQWSEHTRAAKTVLDIHTEIALRLVTVAGRAALDARATTPDS